MATRTTQETPFVLYVNAYSICSIMVRYTLAIRGIGLDVSTQMVVEEREVNIFEGEQMEEAFLCDVNPKGQVPVLSHRTALAQPIQDSLEITFYITGLYPDLVPQPYKNEITDLLKDLHALNFFSLSYGSRPQGAVAMKASVLHLLENPHLSQRYHDALQYKLKIVESEKIRGVSPAEIETQVQLAKSFLSKLNSLVFPALGPWLFGRHLPTALDAHVVVFLARLLGVGKGDLIPLELRRYSAIAMETPEWQAIMKGRQITRPMTG